ncbi:MAG: hypothetical protein M3347_19040 [Armatimonadota bacterium]|nr:hypothetical protein [Armatimonadota bacterium]
MTVTIELAPELESRLQEAAARQGQDTAAFVQAAVEEKLRSLSTEHRVNGQPRLTLEEFEAAMDEMAIIGADIPPPDERITYSREDIYFDHD